MPEEKPTVWLAGEIHTPPFFTEARIEAGVLPGRLQNGETLTMPHSRPMPVIGPRVGELRVKDGDHNWRIRYRTDHDAVIVLDVFDKKTKATPAAVVKSCKAQLRLYDA